MEEAKSVTKNLVTLLLFAAYAATNLFYWLNLGQGEIAGITTLLILFLYIPASHILSQ